MLRYFFAFSCLLLLSACFMHKGTKKTASKAKPKQARLEYGMTREEVLELVKDRTEIMVAEFDFPRGHMVAYQYHLFGKAAFSKPRYYLYFMNDTLIRKSEPEDLRKGAKRAIREYYESE